MTHRIASCSGPLSRALLLGLLLAAGRSPAHAEGPASALAPSGTPSAAPASAPASASASAGTSSTAYGAAPASPASPAASPAARFPLAWPPAPGWRTETIPFPLDFAPAIPLHGVEELRFASGFGKPGTPLYFTYAFVWLVDQHDVLDAAALTRHIKAYFDGLMSEVARSRKADVGPVDTKVSMVVDQLRSAGDSEPEHQLEVSTVDAFFTRKPLRLSMDVSQLGCKVQGKQVWYFAVSPSPRTAEATAALADVRKRLECSR